MTIGLLVLFLITFLVILFILRTLHNVLNDIESLYMKIKMLNSMYAVLEDYLTKLTKFVRGQQDDE